MVSIVLSPSPSPPSPSPHLLRKRKQKYKVLLICLPTALKVAQIGPTWSPPRSLRPGVLSGEARVRFGRLNTSSWSCLLLSCLVLRCGSLTLPVSDRASLSQHWCKSLTALDSDIKEKTSRRVSQKLSIARFGRKSKTIEVTQESRRSNPKEPEGPESPTQGNPRGSGDPRAQRI